jgi:hypothetical protein
VYATADRERAERASGRITTNLVAGSSRFTIWTKTIVIIITRRRAPE